MFQSEGAGDNFAPGIGFAFGLLVAGFEGPQLGIELIAFFAESFEPVGGRTCGASVFPQWLIWRIMVAQDGSVRQSRVMDAVGVPVAIPRRIAQGRTYALPAAMQ